MTTWEEVYILEGELHESLAQAAVVVDARQLFAVVPHFKRGAPDER